MKKGVKEIADFALDRKTKFIKAIQTITVDILQQKNFDLKNSLEVRKFKKSFTGIGDFEKNKIKQKKAKTVHTPNIEVKNERLFTKGKTLDFNAIKNKKGLDIFESISIVNSATLIKKSNLFKFDKSKIFPVPEIQKNIKTKLPPLMSVKNNQLENKKYFELINLVDLETRNNMKLPIKIGEIKNLSNSIDKNTKEVNDISTYDKDNNEEKNLLIKTNKWNIGIDYNKDSKIINELFDTENFTESKKNKFNIAILSIICFLYAFNTLIMFSAQNFIKFYPLFISLRIMLCFVFTCFFFQDLIIKKLKNFRYFLIIFVIILTLCDFYPYTQNEMGKKNFLIFSDGNILEKILIFFGFSNISYIYFNHSLLMAFGILILNILNMKFYGFINILILVTSFIWILHLSYQSFILRVKIFNQNIQKQREIEKQEDIVMNLLPIHVTFL